LTVVRIVPEAAPPYALPMMREKVCKTCLVEHDEAIHEATVSLHQWLRARIQLSVAEPVVEELTTAAA
jgi:hypothetical protein